MARISLTEASPRLCAFLDAIAFSEMGAALLAASDDGYNVLVGSTASKPKLFASYDHHPNILVGLPNLGVSSTAAGRYQILKRTWDDVARHLGDFGPVNQDRAAIALIRRRGAWEPIDTGRTELAFMLCAKEWASLPGAGYGQHENALEKLMAVYREALSDYLRRDFSDVQSGVTTTAPYEPQD